MQEIRKTLTAKNVKMSTYSKIMAYCERERCEYQEFLNRAVKLLK